jgi:hypothetical protein
MGAVAETDVVQLVLPPDAMRIFFEGEAVAEEVCLHCACAVATC